MKRAAADTLQVSVTALKEALFRQLAQWPLPVVCNSKTRGPLQRPHHSSMPQASAPKYSRHSSAPHFGHTARPSLTLQYTVFCSASTALSVESRPALGYQGTLSPIICCACLSAAAPRGSQGFGLASTLKTNRRLSKDPKSRISSLCVFVNPFSPQRYKIFYGPFIFTPPPVFPAPPPPRLGSSAYSAPPAPQNPGRRSGERADYNIYIIQAHPHLFRHPHGCSDPKTGPRPGHPLPAPGGTDRPAPRGLRPIAAGSSSARRPPLANNYTSVSGFGPIEPANPHCSVYECRSS